MKEIKLSPELEILIRAIRFVIGESTPIDQNLRLHQGSTSNQDLQKSEGYLAEDKTLTGDSPPPEFDAGRLMRLAAMHKIRPILAEYDKKFNILDEQTRTKLDAIRSRQIQRNLKMVHVLHQVIEKLESNGLDVIPMKGNLFIHVLYGNQQLRETGDIDILVPRHQVKDAVIALEELGFELNVGYKIVPEQHRDGLLDMKVTSKHQSELKLINGNINIDLHWKLAQPYYGLQTDEEGIFQRAEFKTIYNQDLKIPCTTDIHWMMMVHHGGKEHWKILRHLVDFHFMLKKLESEGIDVKSPEISQTTTQIGVKNALKDGIWLYEHFLKCDENNENTPKHLPHLIILWEAAIKNHIRSFWFFTLKVRIPKSEKRGKYIINLYSKLQSSIDAYRLLSYPKNFRVSVLVHKVFSILGNIIYRKS